MKRATWILGIALAALVTLGGTGCKRDTGVQHVSTFNKVPIDLPKLRQSLSPLTPELQKTLRGLSMDLRYHRYDKALEVLDKLKEEPNLTDAQKKVIDEVAEGVKGAQKNLEAEKPAAP